MKVFLTKDELHAPQTHVVISTHDEENTWANFDKLVQDAEATEIIADDIIEYIPAEQAITVISYWMRKLRHGGKLILTGIDAYLVAKAFAEHMINVDEFNGLIHGNPTNKCINLTTFGLVHFLTENFKAKILTKRIDGYSFVIEAQRP